jgi:hypothetical protein
VISGITDEQRLALDSLKAVIPSNAYLAGGVAVALRFHHRLSRDLDLFVESGNPEDLASRLQDVDPTLSAPECLAAVTIPVASPVDLACMKLSAISGRGARRDFWDLYVLMSAFPKGLPEALASYQKKFPVEDIGHVVRSLAYFADADAEPPLTGLPATTWDTIKDDFRRWVSAL